MGSEKSKCGSGFGYCIFFPLVKCSHVKSAKTNIMKRCLKCSEYSRFMAESGERLVDDDGKGVYDETESAMQNHVCPKCGFHLDLVRGKNGSTSTLRCCNVKCHWEMSLFGSFEPMGRDGGGHVFSKKDLTFLKSCARTCLDCGFLCWCDVHKFYCKLDLPLTVFPCCRFVERVSR